MALTAYVLNDARIYYSSLDATGYSNSVEISAENEDEDITTFASSAWKTRVGGLFDSQASAKMFWQAGSTATDEKPDDLLWSKLGTSTQPLTIVPTGGASGDLCYLTKTLSSTFKLSGDVSNRPRVAMTEAAWAGNQPVARGQILHPQGTARTATGNGTGYQLGAVSAAQKLYANLHVFGVSDGQMIVKIQSSVDNTFASPTDRITFSTVTTSLTAEASSVSGAVTDTWWRTTWTISGGSTHSFLFAVSAGIATK